MALVSIVASLVAVALAQCGLSQFRLTVAAFAGSLVVQGAFGHDGWIGGAALFRLAFLSLLLGAILPMIPRLIPREAGTARAFGVIAQTGNVGSALGPPIFAASAEMLGSIGLLLFAIALCLGGGVLATFAVSHFRRRRAD